MSKKAEPQARRPPRRPRWRLMQLKHYRSALIHRRRRRSRRILGHQPAAGSGTSVAAVLTAAIVSLPSPAPTHPTRCLPLLLALFRPSAAAATQSATPLADALAKEEEEEAAAAAEAAAAEAAAAEAAAAAGGAPPPAGAPPGVARTLDEIGLRKLQQQQMGESVGVARSGAVQLETALQGRKCDNASCLAREGIAGMVFKRCGACRSAFYCSQVRTPMAAPPRASSLATLLLARRLAAAAAHRAPLTTCPLYAPTIFSPHARSTASGRTGGTGTPRPAPRSRRRQRRRRPPRRRGVNRAMRSRRRAGVVKPYLEATLPR